MRRFELTVLGCGAAAPTPSYLTTSQLVNIHEHLILIDCGEGAQLTLRKLRLKFQRIRIVLISHMHADHVLGLPGLIASMNLLGRKLPIDIYGPEELERFIKNIWHETSTHIDFKVNFNVVPTDSVSDLYSTNSYSISSFPTKHRVKTCGFRIEELPNVLSLKPNSKEKYNLNYREINLLKKGINIERKTGVIHVESCCHPPKETRSYVFAADTAYTPKVVNASSGASLLYHESTFMESERDIAIKTSHSTSSDAARVAYEAKVGKLVLGHFSSRYKDLQPLLQEALELFPNSSLAVEGKTISID